MDLGPSRDGSRVHNVMDLIWTGALYEKSYLFTAVEFYPQAQWRNWEIIRLHNTNGNGLQHALKATVSHD